MQVDITDLFIGIVPAIISYFIAVNKSKTQIDSIKEKTENDIKKIRADTEREIEKIEANTTRVLKEINAKTESEIKILEAQSKTKDNEKISDLLYSSLGNIITDTFSDPKKISQLIKASKNGRDKDEAAKIIFDIKDEV